ncbi:DegT/DnrJ/EryC1/StrS family aminotransferase [Candidatus Pelagibacter sp.]|nr:DegT/DnrJ/EryC1/StrS family aminotransferase [Candidatus Pelagibacter sp.]
MKKKTFSYSLLENAFSKKDLEIGMKVVKSGQITMSSNTLNFEKNFAKKNKSNYALMVNSGSSANLLSVAAACNPMRKFHLKKNDEVLIPAVCWSTSLWPFVQYGLKPVFVDIDLSTLNINIDDLISKITKKTKAIMCVHILGLSSNMRKIRKICREKKLTIFEDTCESLGAKYDKINLGNYGDFGTYSFYYSHQITSGEGGMIVCKNKKDYNILKCLRSHGWSRGTDFHQQFKTKYKKLDEKFLFINSGYNLRPLDISAAIGNNQYKRLSKFIQIRDKNRSLIINKIKNNKRWNNQFNFCKVEKKMSPSWFGLPILISENLKVKKEKFTKYLDKSGIENRPIVSGNFLNQPASKLYKLRSTGSLKNAQIVEKKGFFIGLHTKKLTNDKANYIAEKLLDIDLIK